MKHYTMKEVKEHSARDDCWIVVEDKVYDITAFMDSHPGGSSILMSVAGEDVTEHFYALHKPEILQETGSHYHIGYLETYFSKLLGLTPRL